MKKGKNRVSAEAAGKHSADTELAGRFDSLLDEARGAEQAFRESQAERAPLAAQYARAMALDTALTAVMRAAYAAERAEIGPRGYEDRIFRRQSKAKPAVHAWTDEAERLLTLRETHRLTGIPPVPRTYAA